MYWGFVFLFLFAPNIAIVFFSKGRFRDNSTLILNIITFVVALGFLSGKRYNLDRVAAKHVVLSFRFALISALLVMDVALNMRQVYASDTHPTQIAASVFALLFFCMSSSWTALPICRQPFRFSSRLIFPYCALPMCFTYHCFCRLLGWFITDIKHFRISRECQLETTAASIAFSIWEVTRSATLLKSFPFTAVWRC
jgi:hypothetical protein